jgi:cytochrome c nitrite reductase small subunit
MELGEKVIIGLVVVVTFGVIIGAAIGAVFIMPTMMEEMEKPESCASNCHEMQPFYDSFMASPHAEVDCHECHKPHKPEMFLYIGEGLQHAEWMAEGKSFEEMAEEVENKPPASPKNEYCLECHNGEEAMIPSEKIADLSISCFKCHTTIEHTAHRISEYHALESPSYAGYECVACHNDHDMDVKEETCNVCHPPEKHK